MNSFENILPVQTAAFCTKCFVETDAFKTENGNFLCTNCMTAGNDVDSDDDDGGRVYTCRDFPRFVGRGRGRRRRRGEGPTRKSLRNVDKPEVSYAKPTREREDSPDCEQKYKSKMVIKAPYAYSMPSVTDFTIYNDFYFQVGDIVGIRDYDDHQLYYAQLRGFLQDQYCEKSAVISWLLPSAGSPDEGFDPATYFLGPDEEIPRKLEYMEFIMHAPSDYFLNRTSPYPTLTMKPETGFIWTRLDTGIVYKAEECKLIGDAPRFIEVDENGIPKDESEEEEELEETKIADDCYYKNIALMEPTTSKYFMCDNESEQ